MGTILGLPIMRIIVYWGLYWGPPFFEKISNEARADLPRSSCSNASAVVALR